MNETLSKASGTHFAEQNTKTLLNNYL